MWRGQQVAALADDFRVVTLDLPGHGAIRRADVPPGKRLWTRSRASSTRPRGGRPRCRGRPVGGRIRCDGARCSPSGARRRADHLRCDHGALGDHAPAPDWWPHGSSSPSRRNGVPPLEPLPAAADPAPAHQSPTGSAPGRRHPVRWWHAGAMLEVMGRPLPDPPTRALPRADPHRERRPRPADATPPRGRLPARCAAPGFIAGARLNTGHMINLEWIRSGSTRWSGQVRRAPSADRSPQAPHACLMSLSRASGVVCYTPAASRPGSSGCEVELSPRLRAVRRQPYLAPPRG